MDEYVFDCKGNNAPAYGCCRPGDNSGVFVKKDDLNKLKIEIKDMAVKIRDQATVLMAVQALEQHDKNFLCNAKVCNDQQIEYLSEIMRLSKKIEGI